MNCEYSAFVCIHLLGDIATHPLVFMPFRVRLAARLPLSRLVAGPGLPPRCFAAACGFVAALALTNPASSLRGHTTKRTIGRVQLRFLG